MANKRVLYTRDLAAPRLHAHDSGTYDFPSRDGQEKKRGRTGRGVMIVLGPELTKSWVRAGKLSLLTSNSSSFFRVGCLE